MRKILFLIALAAACGGVPAETITERTDAGLGDAFMGSPEGGDQADAAPVGGQAGGGEAGAVSVGGAAGEVAAGAGGAVGTGGVMATGGMPAGGSGGTQTTAVDPLEPFACGAWTVYRVPRGTCLIAHGRFSVWGGGNLCEYPPGAVKRCSMSTNANGCIPAQPGGNDFAGICDGPDTILIGLQAEPGRAFGVTRYDHLVGSGQCPERCD
jgi:hypothetical protein